MKYISPFAIRKNRRITHGDPSMVEEQRQSEENKTQLETLQHDLDEERRRSEEYFTRLKCALADLENLKKRCDRQLEEAKKYAIKMMKEEEKENDKS